MEIGDELSRVEKLDNRLIITGHFLGGGLASAASVVSGFPAHTFNAAGLNIKTLYARDAAGDPIPDGVGGFVELYPGSVARYNAAGPLITAYYTDYDILSFLQDYTTMNDAVGTRTELDSPYDVILGTYQVLLDISIAARNPFAVLVASLGAGSRMVEVHGHPSILYGLLVKEDGFGFITEDLLDAPAYFPGL